jgi:hypothetical protein
MKNAGFLLPFSIIYGTLSLRKILRRNKEGHHYADRFQEKRSVSVQADPGRKCVFPL